MNREPGSRWPRAGILIIFVAPLASLMVIVPSLLAGGVNKVQNALPGIISRLVPNPSPHEPHGSRNPSGAVAQVPAPRPSQAAAPPLVLGAPVTPLVAAVAPVAPVTPVAPVAAPAPVPSPVVSPPPPEVHTGKGKEHQNHGRKRRRRPHGLGHS
jgi:hypothetical protein